MKSSNTKLELWSSEEVCTMLKITKSILYNRSLRKNIFPYKKNGNNKNNYYSKQQIDLLNSRNKIVTITEVIRMETIYYIYPSKLNYLEL
jgi:hypothetical protein